MNSTDAQAEAYKIPLETIDVSQSKLFQDNTVGWYFERLRREAPVHYCAESDYGPFWSVTRFNDIMAVDKNHQVFSSELGGIQIVDFEAGLKRVSFINMDPPIHGEKRKTVSPIVAPTNLNNLQHTIRNRVNHILDNLPRNQTFDWVDQVAVELSTCMLATFIRFWYSSLRRQSPCRNAVENTMGRNFGSESKD